MVIMVISIIIAITKTKTEERPNDDVVTAGAVPMIAAAYHRWTMHETRMFKQVRCPVVDMPAWQC
jgi:hypothetical protein